MNLQSPYLSQRMNTLYPQQNNGITWVQGIEGAKAWQLAPNSNAILLDSENEGRFYIKISDNVGMCSLRIFDYVEVTNTPNATEPNINLSEYVKKSELQALINEILGERNEQSIQPTKSESNRKSLIRE